MLGLSMSDETHPMHAAGTPVARDERAGIVLVYAPVFDQLPPAATGDPLVIGRSVPSPGLSVPHASVSRVHARIAQRGDRWFIADLDSRNGTFVNGRRVTEAELEH